MPELNPKLPPPQRYNRPTNGRRELLADKIQKSSLPKKVHFCRVSAELEMTAVTVIVVFPNSARIASEEMERD
jgi:hypothetical protein